MLRLSTYLPTYLYRGSKKKKITWYFSNLEVTTIGILVAFSLVFFNMIADIFLY